MEYKGISQILAIFELSDIKKNSVKFWWIYSKNKIWATLPSWEIQRILTEFSNLERKWSMRILFEMDLWNYIISTFPAWFLIYSIEFPHYFSIITSVRPQATICDFSLSLYLITAFPLINQFHSKSLVGNCFLLKTSLITPTKYWMMQSPGRNSLL